MGRHLKAMQSALQFLTKEPYQKYIEEVYLYGSCAKGNQKYDSDVDLFVICNQQFTQEIGRKMRLAVMHEDEKAPEVELKFTQNPLWMQAQDPFTKNIRMDGILLWKKQ